MKYYIIPKYNFEETVNATTAAEAIETFATTMEMDMNIYFDVVSEDEYFDYKLGRDLAEQRRMHIEFATDELEDWDHNFSDEDIEEIAEESWEYYCGNKKGADGFTQYECIEKAVEDFDAKED